MRLPHKTEAERTILCTDLFPRRFLGSSVYAVRDTRLSSSFSIGKGTIGGVVAGRGQTVGCRRSGAVSNELGSWPIFSRSTTPPPSRMTDQCLANLKMTDIRFVEMHMGQHERIRDHLASRTLPLWQWRSPQIMNVSQCVLRVQTVSPKSNTAHVQLVP